MPECWAAETPSSVMPHDVQRANIRVAARALATDPGVKAKLDCIHDNLAVLQEQVTQAVMDTQ